MKIIKTKEKISYNPLRPNFKAYLLFILNDELAFNIHNKTVTGGVTVLGVNEVEDIEDNKFLNVGIGSIIETYNEVEYNSVVTLLKSQGVITDEDTMFEQMQKATIHGVRIKIAQDDTYSLGLEDMELIEINK